MEFGVCGDLTMAEKAASASFDYAEWSVGAYLQPSEPEEAFQATLEAAKQAEVPIPVVNCFVPGSFKITGEEVDPPALEEFVRTAMRRAEQAGVDTVVFGSGGARRIPEGFDRSAAHEQLVAFCSMVAPIAADHGVIVVVEPLNRAECNVLTSVGECAALVREVDKPALKLLVDAYHLLKDDDSLRDVAANGELLRHVHIATVPNRQPPAAEECDLAPFFAALREGGYDRRVSIEGKIADPDRQLAPALAHMKNQA